MGDNNKSGGDNHIFQLLTVLITAVVGPLVVFFVTNANKNTPPAAQPTAALSTAVAQATGMPGLTETTVVKPTVTKPSVPTTAATTASPATVTPEGLRNPKGIISAGTTVIVDNLALRVEADGAQVDGHYIRVKLRLRNLDSGKRTLVTTAAAVVVKDNAGKTYQPFYGDKKTACKKQDLTKKLNIALDGGKEMLFQSAENDQANHWCTDATGKYLPLYAGPLGKDAKSLRIGFNNFGPFKDFAIEVDL